MEVLSVIRSAVWNLYWNINVMWSISYYLKFCLFRKQVV